MLLLLFQLNGLGLNLLVFALELHIRTAFEPIGIEQQEQQQEQQMSKENAERLLEALEEDEKEAQEKAQKAQRKRSRSAEKDW